MGLPSELIMEFAKVTKDDNLPVSESTMYGTAVEYSGSLYVRLDGSDRLTPITTTTNIKAGERVMVLIKNHTATVTGNLSSPAARTEEVEEVYDTISEFEIIIAGKVDVEELNAESARIDSLIAEDVTIRGLLEAAEAEIEEIRAGSISVDDLDAIHAEIDALEANKLDAEVADITYATIQDLEATNLEVHNLIGTYGDFQSLTTNHFAAIDAEIARLDAEKISTSELDAKYANIDFSNIEMAAVEELFVKSGIIEDLIVEGEKITGELVGVTIKGDLIEAGTIKADKIVVKGSDGIFYKLNIDAGGIAEGEEVPTDSLHGSVITAKSIVAEKIAVDDLVAFDATIGGINIADGSIYSGVKTSVDNTTTGFYLDKEGQMALGDMTNYITYYKDESGNYHLEIAADTITFGAEKKSIETALDDTSNVLHQEILEQTSQAITTCEGILLTALESYVETGDYASFKESVESELSVLADQISLTFTNTSNMIEELGDDLQGQLNQISTYFTFDIDGFTIGKSDSPYKIVLTNSRYSMQVNGVEVLWIDAVTKAATIPVLTITDRFTLFGYVIELDSNGNLNCEYIGG